MFRQSKLALQGDVEGFSGRGVELKVVEQGELLGAQVGQAAGGAKVCDAHLVQLDVAGDLQGIGAARVLELHTQYAVQNQSHEADQSVGADTVRQAVEDGGDLDFGFEHPEAALDVGHFFSASLALPRQRALPSKNFECHKRWTPPQER